MKTVLSSDNSLGYSRHGYALERVRSINSRRHLDVGCFDGTWLVELSRFEVLELYGADINQEAIRTGKQRSPNLNLSHVLDTRTLPFDNGFFDSVSLLDVLEHVERTYQESLLLEIRRILRPDGSLIVTVPRKHLFSFLDLGNYKFLFPSLHRYFYVWKHGREAYEYRYVHNPFGLVGDVSASKRWHEHFTSDSLKEILHYCGFDVIDVDGAGFFMRIIAILSAIAPKSFLRRWLANLQTVDARIFARANLFVTCTPRESESRPFSAENR